MFKLSEEQSHKKKIHDLLSKGYKFATMAGGRVSGTYRYKYEAERRLRRGMLIVELKQLL
jgi:hypothetical protein